MKKKIIALLTMFLVLSMETTVFAAPSPKPAIEPEKYLEAVGTIKSDEGIPMDKSAVLPATLEQVEEIEELAKANSSDTVKHQVLTVFDFDVLITGTDDTYVFELDVKKDDTVTLWHYGQAGWENTSCKVVEVGDNYVIANFTDLSPIAFVKEVPVTASNTKPATGTVPTYTQGIPTSPKTWDMTAGLMIMMALFGAGTLLSVKKSI